MTETLIAPKIETEPSSAEGHIVCCKTPSDFAGVTLTLCGEYALENGDVELYDGSGIDCGECVMLELTPHCPLGHACRV